MSKCQPWKGAMWPNGYGKYGGGHGGKTRLAHRHVWERLKGSIPEGLTIDHLCSNKACVNIEHLEMVTLAENIRRRHRKRTHCVRGHEYNKANTSYYQHPDGYINRQCKLCKMEWHSANPRRNTKCRS